MSWLSGLVGDVESVGQSIWSGTERAFNPAYKKPLKALEYAAPVAAAALFPYLAPAIAGATGIAEGATVGAEAATAGADAATAGAGAADAGGVLSFAGTDTGVGATEAGGAVTTAAGPGAPLDISSTLGGAGYTPATTGTTFPAAGSAGGGLAPDLTGGYAGGVSAPATAGGGATSGATGGNTGSFWDSAKQAWTKVQPFTQLAGIGVGLGSLGYNIYEGRKIPGEVQQMQNIAAGEQAQGAQLSSYLSTGTLPPAIQAQLDQTTQGAIQALKSKYAALGMPTDPNLNSSLASDIEGVKSRAFAARADVENTLLTTGINETKMASDTFNQIVGINQTQQKILSTSLSNFGAALFGHSGGNLANVNLGNNQGSNP